MTIAAAYLVSEGVVLGADSSTTITMLTPEGVAPVQLLNHSQKVFEVGEKSRIGICTYGAGNIGKYSHRTIVAKLAEKVDDKITIHKATEELIKIVKPKVKNEKIEEVGYYLGGRNPISHEPVCIHVEFKDGKMKKKSLLVGECSFSGQPYIFNRVFRGYDPRLKEELKNELVNECSSNVDNFDDVFNNAFEKISPKYIMYGRGDLPIREAIDFLYSFLHITVKMEKFSFGTPKCGGQIEVGFITTDRPYRWVCHKPFSSAIIEQEGEYDVR